ncbi:MAG: hypothetical protein G01um101417_226 [Parcubacteria group bacterium Gr01-1014_17]|nr:MAG: hypothetical protein G01um101417_226 [Parcubacteria group bacterium Gr01-1014_17]
MQESKLTFVVIGVLVAVVGLGIFVAKVFSGPSTPRTNREVALTCTTDMATQFHIHPNLAIFASGKRVEIPANIGVTRICMNALHTHDTSGTIHVESPEQRDFTLADFFAVWNKQLEDFGTTTPRMTVNGTENAELLDYPMKDKDKIELYFE